MLYPRRGKKNERGVKFYDMLWSAKGTNECRISFCQHQVQLFQFVNGDLIIFKSDLYFVDFLDGKFIPIVTN